MKQTPEQTAPHVPAAAEQPAWLSSPPMLFQNAYVWIVFLSSMDVMLTYVILRLGGREVNPVAMYVIKFWDDLMHLGMAGATVFKFALVVFTIVICEIVGRRSLRKGRRLARVLIVISTVPVVWSLALLFMNRASLVINDSGVLIP